jgi:hypothetical protein
VLVALPVPCERAVGLAGRHAEADRVGDTVTFRNPQGVVAVTAVAPDIVRVRFAPGRAWDAITPTRWWHATWDRHRRR